MEEVLSMHSILPKSLYTRLLINKVAHLIKKLDMLKKILRKIFRPRGKYSFLYQLRFDSTILDVGCGNNSPFQIKNSFPSFNYTGIDIGYYNQSEPFSVDNLIITTPERFAAEIAKFTNHFDAVLSSHNIEHCDDRDKTFQAMLEAIKPGGGFYISFPCEKSTTFPNRCGSLNYFDDSTHHNQPPNFDKFIAVLNDNNFKIEFAVKQYKPLLFWALGLIQEPLSRAQNRTLRGTWAYYGFESIIWAKKIS